MSRPRPLGSVEGDEISILDARAGDWAIFPNGLAQVLSGFGDRTLLIEIGFSGRPVEWFEAHHLASALGVSRAIRPRDQPQPAPAARFRRRNESLPLRSERLSTVSDPVDSEAPRPAGPADDDPERHNPS